MASNAERIARDALEAFLRASGDPRPALDAALGEDPGCVSALLLRAGLAVAAKDRAVFAALDASIASLTPLAPAMTPSELLHLDAARAWRAGRAERAAAIYSRIAARCPLDLLAIRLAQSCWFMLGHANELHEVAARALPHWREDMRGFDTLLAMHAFGLEETGDCVRAESAARRAIAIQPRNACAIHAVAHALDGRGATRAALRWMETRMSDWAGIGAMASHNGWHVARLLFVQGYTGGALAVYDTVVAPALADIGSDAADAAALLWQMELQGAAAGDRWAPVADAFAMRAHPALWPLADVHAAMAFAAAGRGRELDRLRCGLAAASGVAREVALPLVDAIEAFAAGDRAAARAILTPLAAETKRLGGSAMQREALALTLQAPGRPIARAA